MALSDRDREYMRRIGEQEAAAHTERLAEHLALDLEERLRRSFALAARFLGTAPAGDRDDDPGAIYERARALGLYRP